MINKIGTLVGEQIKDSSKIEDEILNYFSNWYSNGEELKQKVMRVNWALIKEEHAI